MLNTITKIVKKGDYFYGVCKYHPNATKYGYVLLHRLIVENHLNRYLTANEVVHHKDHNKHNNNITNLEVCSSAEHAKKHAKLRAFVMLVCPVCGVTFKKWQNLLKKGVISKCSRSCNGKVCFTSSCK
jgi:hypothetical protein